MAYNLTHNETSQIFRRFGIIIRQAESPAKLGRLLSRLEKRRSNKKRNLRLKLKRWLEENQEEENMIRKKKWRMQMTRKNRCGGMDAVTMAMMALMSMAVLRGRKYTDKKTMQAAARGFLRMVRESGNFTQEHLASRIDHHARTLMINDFDRFMEDMIKAGCQQPEIIGLSADSLDLAVAGGHTLPDMPQPHHPVQARARRSGRRQAAPALIAA